MGLRLRVDFLGTMTAVSPAKCFLGFELAVLRGFGRQIDGQFPPSLIGSWRAGAFVFALISLRGHWQKSYTQRFIILLCVLVPPVVFTIKLPLKCGLPMLRLNGRLSSQRMLCGAGVKSIARGKSRASNWRTMMRSCIVSLRVRILATQWSSGAQAGRRCVVRRTMMLWAMRWQSAGCTKSKN